MTRRRILMLGNSHLAAIRSGHALRPKRWPGLQITMVGAKVPTLLDLTIRDDRLIGTSPAATAAIRVFTGAPTVDLRTIDAIFVVGAQLALPRLLDLYFQAAWPGLPSVAKAADLSGLKRVLMSRNAVEGVAIRIISQAAALRLAHRFRQSTDIAIHVISQPRTAEAVLKRPAKGLGRLVSPISNADAAGLSALFEEAAHLAAENVGAIYLHQPPETVSQHVLTQTRYTKGALKLRADHDRAQPSDDVLHANGRYGRRVLDQISLRLGAGA